jgi:hypothetical protein
VFVNPNDPDNTKIHLGMFFNDVGTGHAGFKPSEFTTAINSQKAGLYQLPKN